MISSSIPPKNESSHLFYSFQSEQLLGKLQSSVQVAQENISLSSSMKPVVDELQALLTSKLQGIGDNLWHCAQQQCSSVFSDSSTSEQLRKSIDVKSLFPVGIVQKAVSENTNLLLLEKFNEISNSLCRMVSDSVLDEVVQSLTNIYKILVKYAPDLISVVNFLSADDFNVYLTSFDRREIQPASL